MASGGKAPLPAKWMIDTHGMKEALTTSSNSHRAAIIDAIENGRMLILKTVSEEIKELFPELWESFKSIKNKKYKTISITAIRAASTLQESYGAPILGSIPTKEHFQAVAMAGIEKCKLVTSGKALSHCQHIQKKCKLPINAAVGLGYVDANP